jgi:transposase
VIVWHDLFKIERIEQLPLILPLCPITIAAIEDGVPLLAAAREVVAAFHAMIRKKAHADLDPWLERARASLVASFANGVIKDQAAVSAAITSSWSNGQTEGQITKLKLV